MHYEHEENLVILEVNSIYDFIIFYNIGITHHASIFSNKTYISHILFCCIIPFENYYNEILACVERRAYACF